MGDRLEEQVDLHIVRGRGGSESDRVTKPITTAAKIFVAGGWAVDLDPHFGSCLVEAAW
jgi:hypothetical protein